MASRLNPYLSFKGNAREAMEFYREVLGGELTLTTFAEGGLPHGEGEGDKVMHSQLETPSGFTLMGSDAISGTPGQVASGVQISLSGDAEADAELSGYYDKLAAAGTVVEPLVTAPWGDKFGMVTDQFGILWMVNIAGAQQG
ncbi:MAG TPA: VOC family protein [Candidatus Limnocylindria bacterium]